MNRKFVNIYGNVFIDENVSIGEFTEIGGTHEHGTSIGKDTIISAFTFICPGTKIGRNVFIGPRVTFTNDKYPPSKRINGNTKEWKGVTVEDNVIIGAGVTLLPGITLHRGCKIGAGSVVTKDVGENETWVGNPAKLCGLNIK